MGGGNSAVAAGIRKIYMTVVSTEIAGEVPVRGAARLAAVLQENRELAMLFRTLATLRTDVPVGTVDALRWRGPAPEFERVAQQLGMPGLWDRARRIPLTD